MKETEAKKNKCSCEDLVKYFCNLHLYLSFFFRQPSNEDRSISKVLVKKVCINSGLTQQTAYSVCQFLADQLISDIILSNSMNCYLKQCCRKIKN